MPLRIGCRADDGDKHGFDVNTLLYYKGKLYSGADDGKIIVWSSDLTKLGEVQSNKCSVYSVASIDNTLYSCSNEGTVKSFELDTLKEKKTIVQDSEIEFWKLRTGNGCLYVGDHQGTIKIFKQEKLYGGLTTTDGIKDLLVSKNIIFTGNLLDINITDIHLDGKELQFGTKNNFEGKPPITLIGDNYFAFTNREGKDIVVHENNDEKHFKYYTKMQNAHDKIINALEGTQWKGQNVIFSGGWDKIVKKWVLEGDTLKLESSCEVDIVINAITLGDQGEIYVGGSDGHIVRIEVE